MFGIPQVNIVAPVSIESGWIYAIEHPEEPTPSGSSTKTLTYTISARGNVQSDFEEFRSLVASTLNDPRGWSRAGVRFQEVSSGGNFAVYLQEASIFSEYSGCSTELSCRYGNNVMLNDDRWRLGTDHWTSTGQSLADYRRLIINHEVGHWLGHRHVTAPCSSTSVPAALMIDSPLRYTCAPNIWPLEEELWHSR